MRRKGSKELEKARARIKALEGWQDDACQKLFDTGKALGEAHNEIDRLTKARAKDAEAWESVRAANNVVRERAKQAEEENLRLRAALATSKDPCIYCQPKEPHHG